MEGGTSCKTCNIIRPGVDANPLGLKVGDRVIDDVDTVGERHGKITWIGQRQVAAYIELANGTLSLTRVSDLTREKEVNNESKDSK